jgi:2-polyprenyl-3-methyl-5-hydroxy-6-metoxy-1,4-benzoquinol methylase
MAEDFDQTYGQDAYFGSQESHLLTRYAEFLPPGGRVLDIGIGQGRNALPLARRGLEVVGIDPSGVAVDSVRAAATKEGLSLTAIQTNFQDFQPEVPFDAVLCIGLMQILSQQDGASLIDRLCYWVRPGGVLFFTAWHVDDPEFAELCENWQRLGRRAFYSPEGDYRLFLWRDEILRVFSGWEVVHHWEGLGPPHRHGDGPEERHGDVEVVLVRQDNSRETTGGARSTLF